MKIAVTNNGTLLSSSIDVLASTDLAAVISGGNQIGSLSLATSGAVAGSYGAFSVNAKGQVTTGLPTTATGDVIGVSSGTGIALSLASLGTAGTYSNIVVDGKGRTISARAVNLTDITTGLGFTPVSNTVIGSNNGVASLDANADLVPTQFPTVTMTGDITATATAGTITTTLASVSTVGTFSSMVIDAGGRVRSGLYVINHYYPGSSGVASTTTNFTPANAAPTQAALTLAGALVISPSSTTTTIEVSIQCFVDTNYANPQFLQFFYAGGGSTVTLAVFRNTTCIGATAQKVLAAGSPETILMNFFDVPGTTASTTYSLYYAGSNGTTYINQGSSMSIGSVGGMDSNYLLDLGT